MIIGADEVGRGAIAGPVVAGAVILPPEIERTWIEDPNKLPVVIRDSKKMTPLQRQKSSEWIITNCISYGIGEGSVEQINNEGIMPALFSAFRKAVESANPDKTVTVDKLLIDALTIDGLDDFPVARQEAIIRGDSLSCHIAAASIIAKVYRDQLMERLGGEKQYAVYRWHSNKGYGTADHRNAITEYGICVHHRRQFVKNFSSLRRS